jgi:hypothetical protein
MNEQDFSSDAEFERLLNHNTIKKGQAVNIPHFF